jgi:hypothetical protein
MRLLVSCHFVHLFVLPFVIYFVNAFASQMTLKFARTFGTRQTSLFFGVWSFAYGKTPRCLFVPTARANNVPACMGGMGNIMTLLGIYCKC